MKFPRSFRKTLLACVCPALLAICVPAHADTTPASVARLALDVTRAEDIRAVKRLQTSYAQYSQFGLWNEMAALFASNGEAIYGSDDLKGQVAIHAYYLSKWGNGREGLAPGGLHTTFVMTPVVNLSADGKTAKARWHEFSMVGAYGGSASLAGGIMENDYVKDSGVWKISRIHYYPIFAGPYETGWKNVDHEIKMVPYHFTPASVGVPIPPVPGDLKIPPVKGGIAALSAIDRRIDNMADIDKVTNLQNEFGYYADRKMWDDAADLFSDDAVLEIANLGIWSGAKSIRHSFEKEGPAGVERGRSYDRPIFDTTVWVSPDGTEARARGTEFEMLGDWNSGTASLGLRVFENRFVKGVDNKWRIREMREFPIMSTDYYQGWAKSRLVTPIPTGIAAPDRPVPAADGGTLAGKAIPAFFLPNPVTGRPVQLPKGSKVVATDRLVPAPGKMSAPAVSTAADPVSDAQRRLAIVTAYDGIENVIHGHMYYFDDAQWHEMSLLFADDGWAGNCIGPDHIERCRQNNSGDAPESRVAQSVHWSLQPVINVADDGKSAFMRYRGLRLATDNTEGGVFNNGLSPNDAAALVDGVWKLEAEMADETYFASDKWSEGWARYGRTPISHVEQKQYGRNVPPPELRIKPDVPRDSMKLRYAGQDSRGIFMWPDIRPVWFSYTNPVSGRVPEHYCPDFKTCEKLLESQKQ